MLSLRRAFLSSTGTVLEKFRTLKVQDFRLRKSDTLKMVNIWDFVYAKRVRITTIDGIVYEGDVVAVFDEEETSDENPDEIGINTGGRIFGFSPDEISKIEKVY